MAVAAPITASVKHNGKGQPHALHRRQLPGLGLGVLASPSPGSTIPTPLSATATISSYAFPTTVVQVPVATVCPDTPATSAIFSILPVSSLISMAGLNGTQEDGRSTTQYLSVHVNATAFLPNGSSTVFLSASSTAVIPAFMSSPATLPNAAIGAETARIVLDKNGCQTIYSEKTTALCTTTVRPAGMLPVPITDCNQWVTFSSQRLDVCSGSPPPSPSNSEAVGGPIEFYLAHWYDLDRGAVPNHVQVQDCVPGSTGLNCVTSSESWDVVTSTTTSTGTSVASFMGPVLISVGSITLTTTMSFESTFTTTAVATTSSIERVRLGNDASTSMEQVVTVLVTMPTTRTFNLGSLTRTTITLHQTSTFQVTETKTRILDDTAPTAAEGTT